MTTLLARMRRFFARPDATICRASLNGGNSMCGNPISLAEARAAGHPEFCSHACAAEDLENSPM